MTSVPIYVWTKRNQKNRAVHCPRHVRETWISTICGRVLRVPELFASIAEPELVEGLHLCKPCISRGAKFPDSPAEPSS